VQDAISPWFSISEHLIKDSPIALAMEPRRSHENRVRSLAAETSFPMKRSLMGSLNVLDAGRAMSSVVRV
jgi:hypothetical protein